MRQAQRLFFYYGISAHTGAALIAAVCRRRMHPDEAGRPLWARGLPCLPVIQYPPFVNLGRSQKILCRMQLANLFSTPVAMFEHPELQPLKKELTDILVAESLTIPSVSVSNAGGWHSPYSLHTRPEECFRKLNKFMIASALEITAAVAKSTGASPLKYTTSTEMWAMVMRDGDYTIAHTHAETHWACVFYADNGDADQKAHPNSGLISFADPRMGRMPVPGLTIAAANFTVDAQAGQLLVFPGWLMHYVHAYRGTRPRVSVACNVTLQAK